MTSTNNLLQNQVIGSFKTLHVPNEPYGEIDPNFLKQFHDHDFQCTWKLQDEQRKYHRIMFNGDFSHPLLTKGWNSLRSYYGMEDEHFEIEIAYYGQNLFTIKKGQNIVDTSIIPNFHSRSTTLDQTLYFDHTITSKSFLVFNADMSKYIDKNDFNCLVLCGKKGKKIDANIESDYLELPSCYIEDEWKTFCTRNKFKIGDRVRIKFASVNQSHMVHIFKIIL
ncbi:unnamed protein product [Trifolium pratense]|uniref:Uncharacterized protein n=1 Tax=Trifolium pratense TaxID=57577 RepID=A0ACB0JLB4_TRIPR|nr:unnamed protein product [Trifolium pratense]